LRLLAATLAWLVLPSFTSLSCAPLVGLDQDYYVIAGTSGAASAGGMGGIAGLGGTGGAGMPAVAGVGAGGSSEAGAGGSGQEIALPAGKLAYHRFVDYQAGDSESFIVELPDGPIRPELGKFFQLCGVLSPSFSPDGTKLAVAARPWTDPCPVGNPKQEELEIYVLDVTNWESPSKVRVTENTLPDEDPSFSPSGDFLLAKRDGDIVKLMLTSPAELPHTTCEALAPGSFCFDLDDEQLKPVISSTGLVIYQQGTDASADIWYFDLEAAEAGSITPKAVAARDDTYEARPCISGDWLYFARWRLRDVPADVVARKSLAMLMDPEELVAFGEDPVPDYTDPCGITGDLVVFSSDEGGGLHDIFVGNFADGSKKKLDDLFENTVNSPDEADLSPTFWPSPVP
jgi:hypothetical protein